MHWFNPAVHFMARKAAKDIEITCDILTTKEMDVDAKKRYSQLILSMAFDKSRHGMALTTGMNGGKKMLKQRFASIFANKKRGILLFSVMAVIVTATSLFVGVDFMSQPSMEDDTAYNVYHMDEHSVSFAFVNDGGFEHLLREERVVGHFTSFRAHTAPLTANPSLEAEFRMSDFRINTYDGNSITISSNPTFIHSITQSHRNNHFLLVDSPNRGERLQSVVYVAIPTDRSFTDLDIYIEHGDVVLEDITITGHLNITVINGNVILQNVNVDPYNIRINGGTMAMWNERDTTPTSTSALAQSLDFSMTLGGFEHLRRDVRSFYEWRGNFSTLMLTANSSLEIEITTGNVSVSRVYDSWVNPENAIHFATSPDRPFAFYFSENRDNFVVVDYAGAQASSNSALDITLTPEKDFANLDIYVEHGDVLIENITITGYLNITIVNGELTLRNVSVDPSRISVNGNSITGVCCIDCPPQSLSFEHDLNGNYKMIVENCTSHLLF